MLFKGRRFTFSPENPAVMGILNVTPDSFSDGTVELHSRIETLLENSPEIIDIGGESTRPGAGCIPVHEELERVLPVIQKIRSAAPDILISIDTRKSEVARQALAAGADIVNDISCLHYDPALADAVAEYSAGLILNHSRGTPETMNSPEHQAYPDGLHQMVRDELQESVEYALSRGVLKESIILDPGFGFSKTTQQNIALLKDPALLLSLGYPLLSGPSRKRFIGELTDERSPAERDYGTCGAVIASVMAGYSILRVHNVKAAKDCLAVFLSCSNC